MYNKEYIKLLRTLIQISEANKGIEPGPDDYNLNADGLLTKFSFHALSILYLSKSTTLLDISENPISFFDSASLNVLARAALETFLVFHYIFGVPKSEEERELRYLAWILSGLMERQKYPVQSPQGKQRLQNEEKDIQSLKKKLEYNLNFKRLKKDQQKDLFKGTKWRFLSWKDIGLSAGLNETHAKSFYNYLCGYAHAGSISILQIQQANSANNQKALFSASMGLLMIAMANMI
jgi:hypothetical protein